MTSPVLEYRTPDPAPAWRGGYARGIIIVGAVVAFLALLVPSEVGENITQPNPLRILATWLLLALADWYVLYRLLSTPGRQASRVVVAWSAAAGALLFVYIQIWFLKDAQLPRHGGPWHPAVLWPSGCVFASLTAFAIVRNVRRPVAG